jgi:uncharacterized protein YndB with AHSA1/START domain
MRWILGGIAVLATAAVIIYVIGALLPAAHVAAVQVQLHAQPDSIFNTITDPAAALSWRSDLRSVEILTEPGGPLRWRESTSNGTFTLVAERLEPPTYLVTRLDDPELPFDGRWIHFLEPSAGGTRMTITEEGHVYSPIFRFMSRFVFGHHPTLERYARDLAAQFGDVAAVQRVRPEPSP